MEGGNAPTSPGVPAEAAQQVDSSQSTEVKEPQVIDDPEIELDDGVKVKRSELRDIHKRRKELDRGAFEKMQEAAKMRKEAAADREAAQQIVAGLSKDAKAALRAAGIDPIQFAEQTLNDILAEGQLSPAEKEAREYKAKLAKYEAEEKARTEQTEKQQFEQQVGHFESTFGNDFVEAFKTSGLPPDPFLVGKMAYQVEALLEDGVPYTKDLLREIAIDLDQKYNGSVQKIVQSDQDDVFERFLGESGLERARKIILRKAQSAQTKPPAAPSKPAPVKSGKGLSRAELDARISKRIGA